MKLSALCSIGSAFVILQAAAQQPATTAEQAKQKLEEAHSKTGATKARLEALGREAKAPAASSKISAKDQAAVEALIKEAESNTSEDARQAQITEFLKTASPQVREMYLSTGAPSAPAAPAKPAASDKPAPVVEFSKVPVPLPKVVKAKAAPKKAPQRMVIDSNVLLFNNDSSVAIFRGNVRLRSATMDIDCEELEVVFLKEDGKPGGAPAAAAAVRPKPAPGSTLDPTKPNIPTDEKTAPAADEEPVGDGEQKIDKAWARGKGSIVTIVKRDPKGPSVCKCGDAYYDGKTNNLTMKIFPEAEQQGTRIQATERSTVLVLDQQGKISAEGPVKTIRPDTSKKAPAPTAPGTTPATSVPATPTKPANPR